MSYLPEGEPEAETHSVRVSRSHAEIEEAARLALEHLQTLAEKPASKWTGRLVSERQK